MSAIVWLVLALNVSMIIGVLAEHKADLINKEAETVAKADITDSLTEIVLDLQRKLARQEKRIQFLEKKDRQREKAFGKLDSKVEKLENSCGVHEKQGVEQTVEASRAHSNVPDVSVEKKLSVSATAVIRRQGPRGSENVGFTAYLDHNIDTMAQGHTIKMNQVLLNDGGGYSNATGTFTVPVSGVYLFNYHFNSHYRKTIVGLYVDGKKEVDAIAVPKDSTLEMMGGNTAILRVSAGQSVWLQDIIVDDGEIYSTPSARYATFSGVLMY